MKMIKLEKFFVNPTARARNIKTIEQLFSQIDLSNVKKVFEVGCGVGVLSYYLTEKYKWNVTGIDLDPEQIERAKKDYEEDKVDYSKEDEDRDLAAHITVTINRGFCLYGKKIKEAFKPIPEKYYIDSLMYDLENIYNNIL